MASETRDTPDRAAGLLQEVAGVRARLARRLTTPWWYKALSGLVVAVLFIGVGMTFDNFPFGDGTTGTMLVAVSVASAPTALLWVLRQSTGASVDRYRGEWGPASLMLIALLVLCMAAQTFLQVDWALLVGAGLGFLLTYLLERRTDAALHRGELPARSADPAP